MSVSSINLFARRRAGVLLHLTSLPGYGARGHLGPDALKFGEWLARAGFSVWQMLPVGPTDNEWSPYQSSSAFAFEPSLAASTDVIHEPSWTTDIDPAAHDWERAAGTFFDGGGSATGRSEYSAFLHRQACWLEDYVLYTSIRSAQSNEPWYRWPVQLRDRDPKTLESFARNHASELNVHRYRQFAIDTQWQGFRRHLNSHGVYLFGDLPIFVAHDSADVWSHRELFLLEPEGVLRTVTGVPPDYFSEDGQRWGQPLYDWSAHAAQGYRWWIDRARVQAQRFDLLRLDHFRGFSACWAIPASAATAREGAWSAGPGAALFEALDSALGSLPYVAENLGVITADVEALRHQFSIPGMSVLQFGFDGDASNSNLPHNLERRAVVYTGTHDNDTTLGWWQALDPAARRRLAEYLGWPMEGMPDALIRTAMRSISALAVIPLQDVLQLDSRARMNRPGRSEGNWRWRLGRSQLTDSRTSDIRQLLERYGRIS